MPDDQGMLREVLYWAIFVPNGSPRPGRDVLNRPELARYITDWGRRDDAGIVAEMDGTPVGAAWLRRFSAGEPGYGFVDEATPELSIALLPEYRGQGIGSELLRRLLDAARARFEGVSLSVSAANPARRLYERAGFRPVGTPTKEALTMLLRFHPTSGSASARAE